VGLLDFFRKKRMSVEDVAQVLWVICCETAKHTYHELSELISEFELDDDEQGVLRYELIIVNLWAVTLSVHQTPSGETILDELHCNFLNTFKKHGEMESIPSIMSDIDQRYKEYSSLWNDKEPSFMLYFKILTNMFNNGDPDKRLLHASLKIQANIFSVCEASLSFITKIRVDRN